MSYIGNIPTFTIPKSKYSSTETEYSSDDGGTSYIEDHNGKISVSGFSTSAASSSGSSRKRRRRRRRSTSSNSKLSSSSITLSHRSDRSVSTSTRYSITPCPSIAEYSQTELCEVTGKRIRNVAALNSIYDLKHAIGRHRGISGSFGAVDAALFAMFYVTDIFDGLLTEDSNQNFLQGHHEQLAVRKDIISLLRKEIVYSLRINYFCPASKVVKLVQLIQKQYSLDNIQDSADFLDLLFGKLLKSPSFFTYSDGSDSFIHLLNLENYLARKYYYQPLAITVQNILRQLNVYPTGNIKNDLSTTRGTSFSAVPYPALILKIVRKALNGTNNGSMYYWDSATETHHHPHKRPVIPNLQIDLTDLITRRGNYDVSNLQKSYSTNWDKSTVFNQSLPTSLVSVGKDFSYERKIGMGVGRGVGAESRFVKGLKSAWKTMFHYLEDLTLSSNMIPPESGGGRDFDLPSIETNTHNDDDRSLEQNNSFFTSSTSLSSYPRTTRSTHNPLSGSIHDLKKEPISNTTKMKVKVKMELIAIICKLQPKNGFATNSEKNSSNFSGGYSVYCKTGKDGAEFAPWVLYLPRNGVAPQVQLIENFGTWIDSLERHHESFNLHKVPSEIRTVLEDSHLLIYKLLQK